MTADELGKHGMVRMDEEAIHGFLSSQSVGMWDSRSRVPPRCD